MLENIKKVDRKIIMMIGFLLALIILIIIIMIVINMLNNGKLSYSKIESKMVSGAKSYYKTNSALLPTEVDKTVEVDASTLASEGYIKDLSEYVKDDSVVCSGKVIVAKTQDDYDYVASLDCGDKYKTSFLYQKVLEQGTVTSGEGLYNTEDFITTTPNLGIDEEGYDLSQNPLLGGYVFRGQNVNNFVKIDNNLYRIVKIDKNNDIVIATTNKRLRGVFDDRYNSETDRQTGINDYSVSRAYETLKKQYNDVLISDKGSVLYTKRVTKDLCIGRRSADNTTKDGSAECAKVMKGQYFGLLPAYDIMNASLDSNCTSTVSKECGNYNYIVDTSYWSATGDVDSTSLVYRINQNSLKTYNANLTLTLKYVLFLSNRTIFKSGTGTETDPYILK